MSARSNLQLIVFIARSQTDKKINVCFIKKNKKVHCILYSKKQERTDDSKSILFYGSVVQLRTFMCVRGIVLVKKKGSVQEFLFIAS